MLWAGLAKLVLIVHLAFVVFVVLGGLLTITTLLVGLGPFWLRRGRLKGEHDEGVAVIKDAQAASNADVSRADAGLSNV